MFYGDFDRGRRINLDTGRGSRLAEGDTFISIENVFGSNFNDSIIGSTAANQLHARRATTSSRARRNDYLDGGSGNDILGAGLGRACSTAAAGDDTLKGIGGANTLIGGTGIDTADYSGMSIGVTVSLTSDRCLARLYLLARRCSRLAVADHLSGIENITGSAYPGLPDRRRRRQRAPRHGRLDISIDRGGADTRVRRRRQRFSITSTTPATLPGRRPAKATIHVRTIISYTLTAGSAIEQLLHTTISGTAAINLTGNEFYNDIWALRHNIINSVRRRQHEQRRKATIPISSTIPTTTCSKTATSTAHLKSKAKASTPC